LPNKPIAEPLARAPTFILNARLTTAVDLPYGHTNGLRELEGKPADLTIEEQAVIDALNAEQTKLEFDSGSEGERVRQSHRRAARELERRRLPKNDMDL
jgi:hypothetical protein